MVMARHWYSAWPVVDGHPLLDEKAFGPRTWRTWLRFTPDAFGSDADTVLDTLHDLSAWPAFTVEEGDGVGGRLLRAGGRVGPDNERGVPGQQHPAVAHSGDATVEDGLQERLAGVLH
ncbi:hypothetical protein ACWD4F_41525 [Streptomyces aureus]